MTEYRRAGGCKPDPCSDLASQPRDSASLGILGLRPGCPQSPNRPVARRQPLLDRSRAARAIYYAFAFGAITQAMIAAAGLGRMYFNLREMNFFDNPNQLGYFAVLTSVYLTYFGRQLKINFAWQNFALICAAYICFRSLSRAGAAAIVATILLD